MISSTIVMTLVIGIALGYFSIGISDKGKAFFSKIKSLIFKSKEDGKL